MSLLRASPSDPGDPAPFRMRMTSTTWGHLSQKLSRPLDVDRAHVVVNARRLQNGRHFVIAWVLFCFFRLAIVSVDRHFIWPLCTKLESSDLWMHISQRVCN